MDWFENGDFRHDLDRFSADRLSASHEEVEQVLTLTSENAFT
jgi:hypothetical protein